MMTTGNDDHPEWGGTSVDPVSDSNEDPGSLGARKPLAVFDIDGVLADVRHRLPHVQGRPKDWDAFFAAIGKDPVLPDGLALAQELAAEHRVVYVTGRPEHTRDATTAWLGGQNLPSGRVFMRADDDFRPAREAKLRLMRRLSRFGDVAVVVDDDPAAATWRRRPREVQWPSRSGCPPASSRRASSRRALPRQCRRRRDVARRL